MCNTGSVVLWQRLRFNRKCCTILQRARQETGKKTHTHTQRKRNVSCPDQGSPPLHPFANASNLNGTEKNWKDMERMWDALPEARRRCMHTSSKALNLLCRLLDPPALTAHSSLLCVLHGCFSGLLECTCSCRWLLWILLSVSETRRGCGESEAETGRNSQLCGQGEISSPSCTPVFLQSSH